MTHKAVKGESLPGVADLLNVSHKGWVLKEAGRWPYNLQRRFLAIDGDALFYFKNETAAEALGKVNLTGREILEEVSSKKGVAFSILAKPPDSRVFTFVSDDTASATEWVTQLRAASSGENQTAATPSRIKRGFRPSVVAESMKTDCRVYCQFDDNSLQPLPPPIPYDELDPSESLEKIIRDILKIHNAEGKIPMEEAQLMILENKEYIDETSAAVKWMELIYKYDTLTLCVQFPAAVRAAAVVERLSAEDAEPASCKVLVFGLKTTLLDSQFAEEFIEMGGIEILLNIVKNMEGNIQSYALAAVRTAMSYVSGIEEVMENSSLTFRLFSLIEADNLGVVRGALELLFVLCNYDSESGFASINAAASASANAWGRRPYETLIRLLDFEGDVDICTNTLTLLNSLLQTTPTDEDQAQLLRVWESLGLFDTLRNAAELQLSDHVTRQLELFELTSGTPVFPAMVSLKNRAAFYEESYMEREVLVSALRYELGVAEAVIEEAAEVADDDTKATLTSFYERRAAGPEDVATTYEQELEAKVEELEIQVTSLKELVDLEAGERVALMRELDDMRASMATLERSSQTARTSSSASASGITSGRSQEVRQTVDLAALEARVREMDTIQYELQEMTARYRNLSEKYKNFTSAGVKCADCAGAFEVADQDEVVALQERLEGYVRDNAALKAAVASLEADLAMFQDGSYVPGTALASATTNVAAAGATSGDSTATAGGSAAAASSGSPDGTTDAGAGVGAGAGAPPPPPPPGGGPPPPPPPPGGGPPPPPPPPGGGPPPPPPPPGGGPPPPPPPGGAVGPAKNAPTKPVVKPACKMKPLFWKRIIKEQGSSGTLWHNVKEANVDIGLLEERFAQSPSGGGGAGGSGKRAMRKSKQPAKLSVLDSKRSQAISFLLAALPDVAQLKTAIKLMDDDAIPNDVLENLIAQLPTGDEVQAINDAMAASALPIDKPEQFVLELASIPMLGQVLKCWTFTRSFGDIEAEIEVPLEYLLGSVKAMRTSQALPIILAHVLAVGNYMNGGTKRGQADGFEIEVLPKLTNTKGADGITLLDHIVDSIRNSGGRGAAAGVLPEELAPLQDAIPYTFPDLEGAFASVTSAYKRAKNLAEAVLAASPSPAFKSRVPKFLADAEKKLGRIEVVLGEAKDSYFDLLGYCGVAEKKRARVTPAEFFGPILEFAKSFGRAWEAWETARLRAEREAAAPAEEKKKKGHKGAKIGGAGPEEDPLTSIIAAIKSGKAPLRHRTVKQKSRQSNNKASGMGYGPGGGGGMPQLRPTRRVDHDKRRDSPEMTELQRRLEKARQRTKSRSSGTTRVQGR